MNVYKGYSPVVGEAGGSTQCFGNGGALVKRFSAIFRRQAF